MYICLGTKLYHPQCLVWYDGGRAPSIECSLLTIYMTYLWRCGSCGADMLARTTFVLVGLHFAG